MIHTVSKGICRQESFHELRNTDDDLLSDIRAVSFSICVLVSCMSHSSGLERSKVNTQCNKHSYERRHTHKSRASRNKSEAEKVAVTWV